MSNLTENRIDTILSEAGLSTIKTGIAAIAAELPAGTLDEQQRKSYRAIDVSNKVFCEDAVTEISISGAGIMPPFISAVSIQKDLTLFEQLDGVEASLQNVMQKIADLKRIAGHEAYNMAAAAYKIYSAANAAGIPGAKQAYEKLKPRFDAQGNAGRTTAEDLD